LIVSRLPTPLLAPSLVFSPLRFAEAAHDGVLLRALSEEANEIVDVFMSSREASAVANKLPEEF